jgi:thiamine transport system ATP-binding protein
LKLDSAGRQSVFAALSRVGLGGYERRLPGSLSGGERQRVALARALVRRRPILLLDEPFAALDPAMRADMAKLLQELRAETKSTMLFISHQPEDIRRLADRVLFLSAGAIVLDEPARDFLSRREPPAVAKFLGHSEI